MFDLPSTSTELLVTQIVRSVDNRASHFDDKQIHGLLDQARAPDSTLAAIVRSDGYWASSRFRRVVTGPRSIQLSSFQSVSQRCDASLSRYPEVSRVAVQATTPCQPRPVTYAD